MIRESLRVAAAVAAAFAVTLTGVRVSRWLEGPPPESPALLATQPAPSAQAVRRGRQPDRSQESIAPLLASTGPKSPAAPLSNASRDAPSDGRSAEVRQLAAAPSPPEVAENFGGRRRADDRPATGPAVVRGAPLRPLAPGRRSLAMHTVEIPGEVRRAVPRSPAFDLAFEMTYGHAPFVSPAADPALATDEPPLTLRTADFDAVVTGDSTRREPIRVEEILAAMPPPPSLVAADGDSPLRLGMHVVQSWRHRDDRPSLLVEVAAHATGPAGASPPQAARRICLVLDQSVAGGRLIWPRICRGLAAVAGQLGKSDRATVVLCGGQPRVALREADPARLAALAADLEWLPPAAAADLDAGLRLAERESGSHRTVVVAHSDTLDRGRASVRKALAGWHRGLAAAGGDSLTASTQGGPRFVILDATAPGPDRRGEPSFGRTGHDAAPIRRELLRQVLRQETLVAAGCRMQVQFDPASVSCYRLLGHRQSAVESLSASPPEPVDLHIGETVRAVYEVLPAAGSAGKPLATARLAWRTPAGVDHAEHVRAAGARDGGAELPSPHGCELLLASIVGEVLGASPHLDRPGSPLAAAAAVAAAWRDRDDITPFGAALLRGLDEQRLR